MIGFRNLAVHDYSNLSIEILISIINNDLSDIETFAKKMLIRCA